MSFLSTTTISVLRGTTVSNWGDEVDSVTVVHSGIPASIMERQLADIDPSSGNPRTARVITGRVPAGTDVVDGDRIKDETTNVVYAVDAISMTSSPIHTPPVRLDLTRTT